MTERIQLNLRFDKYKDLYEAIKAEAKEQDISINQFVVDALKRTLGQETESISSPEALTELEGRLEERLVSRLVVLVDEKIAQVLAKQEIDLGELVAWERICYLSGERISKTWRQYAIAF